MLPTLFELKLLHPLSTAGVVGLLAFVGLLSMPADFLKKLKGKPTLWAGVAFAALLGFFILLPKWTDARTLEVPINSYGFCIMVGFLLGAWICTRRARPLGLNTDIVLDVTIIAMIFGIIGSKIFWAIESKSWMEVGRGNVLDFLDGGFNPVGGLILGPVPYLFWWWRARAEEKIELFSWKNGVLLGLTVLFAVVGCRAWHLWQHHPDYSWKLFTSWQSGFVWYGGLVLGIPAGTLYAKMRGQSVAVVSDLCAPSVMLGLGFGRIGCFLNSCCFGKTTDFLLGTKYPHHPRRSLISAEYPPGTSAPVTQPWDAHYDAKLIKADATHSLPIHPAQLYETAACFAIFFLTSWYWKKRRDHPGETILLMIVLYGFWRFLAEFLRADPERSAFSVLGMSTSQTFAVVSVVVAGIWFYFLRTKPQPAPVEAPKK